MEVKENEMDTKRYVIRVNDKEEVDESIIVGDVVTLGLFSGVVIGFTSKKSGQYRVAVHNGDIEDWINPEKVDHERFELHTIGDIVNAVGEINKTQFEYF